MVSAPRPEPGAETASVPDMTASLKAKVSVSDADQADPAKLARVYDAMADRFLTSGLNLDAITAVQQYYTGIERGAPAPLPYASFPTPIPLGAVRLFVMFFQDSAPEITRAVSEAAGELARLLPSHAVHVNEPSDYHITVYMTSQPHTLRGDPFDALAPPVVDPSEAVPAEATLARELELGRTLASAARPPALRAHRVLLADSGTLLLTLVDDSGRLTSLRAGLRAGFPNGPPKQATIVHCSIARLLAAQPLGDDARRAVEDVCARATAKLDGASFVPRGIHHIQETTFTTVVGPRVFLPFGSENAGG